MDLITAATAALALGAGALAAFNPCGFALLPAYITVIVTGSADEKVPQAEAMRRAVGFGSAMTVGFIAVFGVFGAIFAPFQSQILPYLGYVTVAIGLALLVLGIYVVRGGELKIPGMTVQGRAPKRDFGSQVLYGVSFALASLSCTIGPFLAVGTVALRESGWVGVLLTFILYGVGMGAVVIVLSLMAAGAGAAAVRGLRKYTPVLTRISGVLMMLAALYVLWYGTFELRLLHGGVSGGDTIISEASQINTTIVRFVDGLGTWGIVALAIVAAAAIAWVFLRGRTATADTKE